MNRSRNPWNRWLRIALLVGAGVSLGAAVNAVRPTGSLPWYTAWRYHVEARALEEGIELRTAAQIRDALATGEYMLLDARPSEEYYAGCIPGALSLPFRDVASVFPDVQPLLFRGQPVVTYCSGPTCDDGLLLGLFLREQGYEPVYLFPGGMEAWRDAGYDVEGGP